MLETLFVALKVTWFLIKNNANACLQRNKVTELLYPITLKTKIPVFQELGSKVQIIQPQLIILKYNSHIKITKPKKIQLPYHYFHQVQSQSL